MERHIPKIVGSWLAGLYDRDRGVSRAASDGLSSFLNTPEKSAQFWKKCQGHVLDFAISAIQETKDTLSDDRSTTPEDVDAKYFRVVNAGLSLLCSLLAKLKEDDVDRFQEKYDAFFEEPTVWKSVSLEDTQVRRTACQLMVICLDKRKSTLEGQLSRLKKEFVVRGLKSSQMGSASEFAKSLTAFTNAFPQSWADKKKERPERPEKESDRSEKSPFFYLFTFLAAGSHGSAPQYWEAIEQLVKTIPIPRSFVFDTVQNFRSGVEKETRFHSNAAWISYLHVCRQFLGSVINEAKGQYGNKFLRPILTGSTDTRVDKEDAPRKPVLDLAVIQECYSICESDPTVASAAAEWISDMEASLSKRLASPNDEAIARDGGRWFDVVGRVQRSKKEASQAVETLFDNPSAKLVKACVNVLSNSPQSAAAVGIIRRVVDSTSYIRFNRGIATEISSVLGDVGKFKLESVLSSPSRTDFLACLQAFDNAPEPTETYARLWKIWTSSILQLPATPEAWSTMAALLSTESGAALAKADDDVKAYIFEQCRRCIKMQTEDWSGFEFLIKRGFHSNDLLRLCLGLLKDNTSRALHGLVIVSRHASSLSDDEAVHETHKVMLLLAESEDDNISSKAREVLLLLGRVEGKKPAAAILKENLEQVGPNSLR
jgi:hypothetical protein